MPSWDSLHVLIIHFPIALLLLSPIFILISTALTPPKGRPYIIVALIIMVLGTASLFLATASGHSAAELADRDAGVAGVLKIHEELGEESGIVFGGLTAILFCMVLVPKLLRRDENRLFSTFLPSAFLALYTVGILFLINTAHAGGRLVHEFGVHALLPVSHDDSPVTPEAQAESSDGR